MPFKSHFFIDRIFLIWKLFGEGATFFRGLSNFVLPITAPRIPEKIIGIMADKVTRLKPRLNITIDGIVAAIIKPETGLKIAEGINASIKNAATTATGIVMMKINPQ